MSKQQILNELLVFSAFRFCSWWFGPFFLGLRRLFVVLASHFMFFLNMSLAYKGMCSVPICKNEPSGESSKRGIIFFLFPSDEKRRKRWLDTIGRNDIGPSDVICSAHFRPYFILTDRNFVVKLSADAIPCIDANDSETDDEVEVSLGILPFGQKQLQLMQRENEEFLQKQREKEARITVHSESGPGDLISTATRHGLWGRSIGTNTDDTEYKYECSRLELLENQLKRKLAGKNEKIEILEESISRMEKQIEQMQQKSKTVVWRKRKPIEINPIIEKWVQVSREMQTRVKEHDAS